MTKLSERVEKLEVENSKLIETLVGIDGERSTDHIGLIGKLIGSRNHAPTNIAFCVLVLIGIMLIVTVATPSDGQGDRIQWLVSALLTVLAYIFGRGGKD